MGGLPCVFLVGAPLYEILAAGEWRSPAFAAYIDSNRLESDLVVQVRGRRFPFMFVSIMNGCFEAYLDDSGSEDE